MNGAGKDTYACQASGTGGTRRGGQICELPQWMASRTAMVLLRSVLPNVMFSAQELAIETILQAGHRTPSEAEQRLGYLEELTKRPANDYVQMETPSEALKQKAAGDPARDQ